MNYKIDIQFKSKPSQNLEFISFQEITKHIKTLNDEKYALIVSHHKDNSKILSIVFDKKGFICFYYDRDEYYLVNTNQMNNTEEGEIYLGHESVRPIRFFNKIEDILSVTQTFFEKEDLDKNYIWEIF